MAGQTDWGGIALGIGALGALYLAWQSGIFTRLAQGISQPPAALTSPLGYCAGGAPVNPTTNLCPDGTAPTTVPIAMPPGGGQPCMGQDALGNACPCAPGSSLTGPFATGNLLGQQQSPYGGYGTTPYGQMPTMYGYAGFFGGGFGAQPGMPGAFGAPGGLPGSSFGFGSSLGGLPGLGPGGFGSPYSGSPYGLGQQSPYGSPYGQQPGQPLGYAQGGGCNCTNCGGQNTIAGQGYGVGGIGSGLYPGGYPGYPYGPIGGMPSLSPGYPYPQPGYPYPTVTSPPYPYPPIGGGIGGFVPGGIMSPYPSYPPIGITPPIIPVGIPVRRYGYLGRASADLNGYAGKAIAVDGYGLR